MNKAIKYEEYKNIKTGRDEITRLHVNLQNIIFPLNKQQIRTDVHDK